MITVIADDITGAAEIAGIGLRFGLRVNLTMYTGEETVTLPDACDLMVYATDTRSMPEGEAIAETIGLARALKANGQHRLFKKTDSALRGYIVGELRALMEETDMPYALLLPQNPRRGRIIKNGVYYVNDVPLNETPFAYDPEFPAITANVVDYFKGKVVLSDALDTLKAKGIYIANASTSDEVASYVASLNDDTIPAGGADFFTCYLIAKGFTEKSDQRPFDGLKERESIIVCGSTSKHTLADSDYIRRKNIPAYNMPENVFFGESPVNWISDLKAAYQHQHSLMLQINHPPQEGRNFALRLRQTMGEVVRSLLSERDPQELIIEGGATAYAILGLLNWRDFKVEQEVSPGVIRIVPTNHPDVTVTLKPGSYSWGGLFR